MQFTVITVGLLDPNKIFLTQIKNNSNPDTFFSFIRHMIHES